jgi:hypothetical protein
MNTNEIENQLKKAIERLEASADQLIKTSGYTTESRKLKMLVELIREQIKNENSNHTAGEIR